MPSDYLLPSSSDTESLVVLAVGMAGIVLIGIVAMRATQSAILRRLVWRAAVVTGLALVALEFVGLGRGVSDWWSIADLAAKPSAKRVPELHSGMSDREAPLPPTEAEFRDTESQLELGNQGISSNPRERFVNEGASPSGSSDSSDATTPTVPLRAGSLHPTPLDSPLTEKRREHRVATVARPWNAGRTRTPTPLRSGERSYTAEVTSGLHPPLAEGLGAAAWFSSLWLVGFILVFAVFACGRIALVWFRIRHMQPAPDSVNQMAHRMSKVLGVPQAIHLLEVQRLRSPVAFGIWRPTIAVPRGFEAEFDRPEREAILAHEIAHIVARDPAWQLAADALASLLWWHPGIWWIRMQLRRESEAAADEACLVVPGGPNALAAALLTLGRKMATPDRLAWLSVTGLSVTSLSVTGRSGAGGAMRSSLARRITRLLKLKCIDGEEHQSTEGTWLAPAGRSPSILQFTIPLVLVFGILIGSALARPSSTRTQGETTMNVLKMSWKKSLAAAALAALATGDTSAPAADEESAQVAAEETIEIELDADTQPVGFDEKDERIEERERELREGFERLEAGMHELRGGHRAEALRAEKRMKHLHQELERGEDLSEDDRAKLESQMRKAQEHMKDVERHVDQNMQELENRRQELESGKMELKRHQVEAKADKLEKHAGQLQRELGALSERGYGENHPKARALRQKLEQIHKYIRQCEQEHHEIERDAQHRELEHLRHEVERHHQLGQHERAEDIAREAERLAERMEGHGRERQDQPRADEGDLRRRLEHLHAAAENLAAAGMHDKAEELMRHAEEMAREHEERLREHDGERHGLHETHRIEALEEEIGDLRKEIGELHEHLENLNHRLNDVLEHLERDRERDREQDRKQDGHHDRDDHERDDERDSERDDNVEATR